MWFYALGDQRVGPVDAAALDDLIRQGALRAETLVWQEGMAGWQPLGAIRTPGARPVRYGGFWLRFVARILDSIIVGIASAIIRIPLALPFLTGGLRVGENESGLPVALPAIFAIAGLGFLIQLALGLGYEMYFLSTRGATPGKMALGLKVVRNDGGPISLGLAAGRYFATFLSSLTLLIGYIIAAFDDQKRSLHDRICGTLVIRQN